MMVGSSIVLSERGVEMDDYDGFIWFGFGLIVALLFVLFLAAVT
jgi:hypothetical protein